MTKLDEANKLIARISGKNVSELQPGQDLLVDLGIDSPKALELLVELEEVLNVEISDEDAARLESVGDVLRYVERVS